MDKFKNSDECSHNPTNRMGLRASPISQGTFYLSTQNADEYPYCQHLYSITLKIGNAPEQKIDSIQVNLQGSTHKSHSFSFDKQLSTSLKANSDVARIFSAAQSLDDVTSVSIACKTKSGTINPFIQQVIVTDIETTEKLYTVSNNERCFSL